MANAPNVAMDIKKNSVKKSPFLILFQPSLITGNPTGMYAIEYQTILTHSLDKGMASK